MARQRPGPVKRNKNYESELQCHFVPIQNAKETLRSIDLKGGSDRTQRAKVKIGDLSNIGAGCQTKPKSGINNISGSTSSGIRSLTSSDENVRPSASSLSGETSESGHSDTGLVHPRFSDKATYVRIEDPELPIESNPHHHNGPRRRDVRFADTNHVAAEETTTKNNQKCDYKRSRSESPKLRQPNSAPEASVKWSNGGLKSASEVSFGNSEHRGRSRERRRQSSTVVSYNSARPTTFPLKMTTFTSESDGVTQEYVFPCENVNSSFIPTPELPTRVHGRGNVHNFEDRKHISKRSSDSDAFPKAENRLKNNNKLKLRETKSLMYLTTERTSVSAPTSPTFRKSLWGEHTFAKLWSHTFGSLESSPASSRNESPDSAHSLPSTCGYNSSSTETSWHQTIPVINFTRASISQSTGPEHETYDNVDDEWASSAEPAAQEERREATLGKNFDPKYHCRSSMRDEKNAYTLEDRSSHRRRSETVFSDFSDDISSASAKPRKTHRSETFDAEPIRPTARRAAVVSSLPNSDLTCLSDTIASMQRNQPVGLTADLKRSRWNFFKSKDKDRSNMKLEEVLHSLKAKDEDLTLKATLRELTSCKGESRFRRPHGTKYSSIGAPFHSSTSTRERKRHDAVWELFTSERTYLMDHLLVLQQVFMEPLQDLQCDGYLLAVDVRSVFGNLEEVCKVSLDFCRALLNVVGDKTYNNFGCANSIEAAFESFGSVLCPPYQRYCTSYTNSITYREELKSNEDFALFLKWCERNPRCQRLKLNDFLVSPMQHLTKYPLLLRHIAEYTSDKSQNALIETTLLAVQESLKALEGKVSWLTQFQFLQDLQGSISWPPVYDLDTKTTLPEPLRQALSIQPCRNLIANPKRNLIFDGTLCIIENGRSLDAYTLLFDDMMIFTRSRKGKRKSSEIPSSLKRHPVLKDGTLLTVHRQPVALDRFMVYDVETEHASALGVKNAFLVVQENRFQQMTSVTMLQAPTEELKRKWLTQLASTAAQWMEKHVYAPVNIISPSINRKTEENGLSSHELTNVGRHSQLSRQKSVESSDIYTLSETYSSVRESKSPALQLNGSLVDA